jgi:putative ABC transport system substrate-binding protein
MTMWCSAVGCLVTLILSLLVVPLAADTQPAATVPRIGVLLRPDPTLTLEEFRQGLRELGWVESQNIALEVRMGETEQLPALAAELVRLKVDVMVTMTTPAALAARDATTTIPIVMAAVAHPVEQGLIASLARPGGNITGLTHSHGPEFFSKGLELLKEATPGLSRVAVLFNTSGGLQALLRLDLDALQAAARVQGITLVPLDVQTLEALTGAFATIIRAGTDGLFVFPIGLLNTHAKLIADFATTHRLSTMFHRKESVQAGGLMSYYTDQSALRQHAATYVDKILKGAKPADLPVEQPMKFELVINLKTAQALGITIPPSVLFRADEVIR